MERLQIREMSRLLAQRQRMSIGDAERFVTEVFGTIADGLKEDRQVIVNGLGTFKLGGSKEKETVMFAPDAELAEEINAPFANFKTVEITVVEEGSAEFSESAECRVQSAELSEDSEDSENSEDSEHSEHSEYSEYSEYSEMSEQEPLPVEEKVEDKVEALSEKVEALTEQMERKARSRRRMANNLLIAAVAAVILALIGGGYYSITEQRKATELALQKEQEMQRKAAEQKHRQDSINEIKRNIASLELTDEQKQAIVGKGKDGAPEYPCDMTLEEAKTLLPRAGYKITGTVTVLTVKEGMTMADIAQEYGLQQGEFLIQVHNAVESVKEGQKIRIPLVELK